MHETADHDQRGHESAPCLRAASGRTESMKSFISIGANHLPGRDELVLGLPQVLQAQTSQAGDGRRYDEARRHPEGHLHHAVIRNSGGEATGICHHARECCAQGKSGLLDGRDRGGCDDLVTGFCAAHDPVRDKGPTLADAHPQSDDGRDQCRRGAWDWQKQRRWPSSQRPSWPVRPTSGGPAMPQMRRP